MCVKDEDESDEADDDSVDDKLDQYEEEITSISRTGSIIHKVMSSKSKFVRNYIWRGIKNYAKVMTDELFFRFGHSDKFQ